MISDTHVPPRPRVPAAVYGAFDGVSAILHAGDFVERSVLDELAALSPVHGVVGNMDRWPLPGLLPERAVVDLAGTRIGIVHDSGPSRGRRQRLRRSFPECRVVVFGHSHQPLIEDDGELLLLNPGSACDPRRAKIPTVALLVVAGGEVRARLVRI